MTIKKRIRESLAAVMRYSQLRSMLRHLSHNGLIPPWIWKRLPVEAIFQVSTPDGSSFQYAAIANDGIGRALFWRGLMSWEVETTSIFYSFAQHANLVLDIGANTGVFSLLACVANPASRVICFEPVPRIFDRLNENIRLNNWEDRCQTRCEAVSDMIGSVQFHVPLSALPTSASLHMEGFRGTEGVLIDVPVTKVDAIVTEEMRVDLVKIDVEGFEDKVLMGMRSVLTNSSPVIIFECNPDGPCVAIEAIFKDVNYQIFHITKQGLVSVDSLQPDEDEVYRNFVAAARIEQVIQNV